ncbi:MAG: hypothetical protein ACE5H3_03820 [Planctomycetota bacterium]
MINLSASGICLRIAGMVPDGAAVALELGPDRIALTLAWSLAGAKPEHGTLARFSALGHVVDGPGRTGAEPPGG